MTFTKLVFAAEIAANIFEIGDYTYGIPVIHVWHKRGRLTIGKYCSIAEDVHILLGGNHHTEWISTFPLPLIYGSSAAGLSVADCEKDAGDVTIGNDVWIGQGARILPGVTIGDGAIIGAYSVVRSDVESYSIVTGNLAQETRKRFPQEVIETLLALRWWDWPDGDVASASDLILSPDVGSLLASRPSLFGCKSPAPNRDALTDPKSTSGSLDRMTGSGLAQQSISALQEVRSSYLDIMVKCISNTIYGDASRAFWQAATYDPEARRHGTDWPEVAHSMIGVLRLDNLRALTETIIKEAVPGDLIETGVWRGGACILMRAVLKAYQDESRTVFVADSFQGIPPPNEAQYPADAGQTFHLESFLAVSKETVADNFATYGLLDRQVEFVPGWFKDTLHKIRSPYFALIRLDGDLYESTIQALDALYPRLSLGGFIIVDDYGSWPNCRQAVTDFRQRWDISDPIVQIDSTGVFWRKQSHFK